MKISFDFKLRLFLPALSAVLLFSTGAALLTGEREAALTPFDIFRLVALTPAAEEIFFRGIVLSSLGMLRIKGVKWFAVVFSAVFFAFIHPTDAFASALFGGVVLALISYGDGLVPLTSICVHSAYNATAALTAILSDALGIHSAALPVAAAASAMALWLAVCKGQRRSD